MRKDAHLMRKAPLFALPGVARVAIPLLLVARPSRAGATHGDNGDASDGRRDDDEEP